MVLPERERVGSRALATARTAVVVPLYRQGEYVTAAVESALQDDDACVVLVNDGCPTERSAAATLALSAAHRERVVVVDCDNEGVSTARNIGIDLALALMPALDYLFLLDADNLLSPGAFARLRLALDLTPGASWAYPALERFGLESFVWAVPRFSLLDQIRANQCDVAVMLRADVLRAGYRFAPHVQGYEDWEFFLRLALDGHVGVYAGEVGFHYRVKEVSMLTDSRQHHDALAELVQDAPRLAPRSGRLLHLEHRDRARYALTALDGRLTEYATDLRSVGLRVPGPPRAARIHVSHAPGVLGALRGAALYPTILHLLQQTLDRVDIAGAHLTYAGPSEGLSVVPDEDEQDPDGGGVHIALWSVRATQTDAPRRARFRVAIGGDPQMARAWGEAIDLVEHLRIARRRGTIAPRRPAPLSAEDRFADIIDSFPERPTEGLPSAALIVPGQLGATGGEAALLLRGLLQEDYAVDLVVVDRRPAVPGALAARAASIRCVDPLSSAFLIAPRIRALSAHASVVINGGSQLAARALGVPPVGIIQPPGQPRVAPLTGTGSLGLLWHTDRLRAG